MYRNGKGNNNKLTAERVFFDLVSRIHNVLKCCHQLPCLKLLSLGMKSWEVRWQVEHSVHSGPQHHESFRSHGACLLVPVFPGAGSCSGALVFIIMIPNFLLIVPFFLLTFLLSLLIWVGARIMEICMYSG